MTAEPMRYEVDPEGIATLTIDRPSRFIGR
jgi:hypothetical protein